jgi:hypothetical protein
MPNDNFYQLYCGDTYKKSLKIPKFAIQSHKSTKDRQYNDQKKKNKRTNNGPQNTTQEAKDRATRALLKHTKHYTEN